MTLVPDAGSVGAQRGRICRIADGLSPREAEVLRLVAAGKRNREIADALVISIRTVETHVARTYTKLGAANRTEAAVLAMRHRLVG